MNACAQKADCSPQKPLRLFCQDETRLGLMPTARRRVTARGRKPIQQVNPGYKNYYVYGAVAPLSGKHFFTREARLNTDGFQNFLDGFSQQFPESFNVLVLDNGSFHKANRLDIPENVALLFLPPYSPELNPAERLWEDLKDALAFHLFESLAALKAEVESLLHEYTEEGLASLAGFDYLIEAAMPSTYNDSS